MASNCIEVTTTQGLHLTKTLGVGKTSMLQTSALSKTAQINNSAAKTHERRLLQCLIAISLPTLNSESSC